MKLIDLPNLSTKRLQALSESGIDSILDLLNFFPRRYLDRTTVLPIRKVSGQGEKITVVGRIKKIQQKGYGNKRRLEVIIQDDTAALKGVWFKGGHYIRKQFSEGEGVAFFGQAKKYGRYVSMAHPEYDKIGDSSDIQELKQIVPIYPSNKALSKTRTTTNIIHNWQKIILKHEKPPEFLPDSIRQNHSFRERHKAYRMIHVPKSESEYKQAFKRFKFEELFLFELSVAKTKHEIIEKHQGPVFDDLGNYTSRFFNKHLPFELTEGQKSALSDIKKDVRSGKQMNRLIQGDVGSGKTIVALGAILMAIDNGYQAAFMAPTEILAEQHYRTLSDFLAPMDINIRLLVGNQKSSLRTDILTAVEGGSCDIVVGTHAVIQDEVNFNNLGLAVIDEQHRFGVKQRAEILEKGLPPTCAGNVGHAHSPLAGHDAL
ncbi:MAG: DEAD/DEAH box helicase [Fodinibius sp.]|nr:DEAD/DEAH box helicase [Fodinibius sp.]